MVKADFRAYLASTLAALPVGANNNTLNPKEGSAFTRAPTKDVLPVPA